MVIESEFKDNDDLSSIIREFKQKYTPEELKSILLHFKDPLKREIARKLFDLD